MWTAAGQLHSPAKDREIRELTRYRKKRIEQRTSEPQRLAKVLEDSGIKIDSVASALTMNSAARLSVKTGAWLLITELAQQPQRLYEQLRRGRLSDTAVAGTATRGSAAHHRTYTTMLTSQRITECGPSGRAAGVVIEIHARQWSPRTGGYGRPVRGRLDASGERLP